MPIAVYMGSTIAPGLIDEIDKLWVPLRTDISETGGSSEHSEVTKTPKSCISFTRLLKSFRFDDRSLNIVKVA